MSLRVLLFFCGLFFSVNSFSQKKFVVVKDLETAWQYYNGQNYVAEPPNDLSKVKSIHFVLTMADDQPGNLLRISGFGQIALYINGALMKMATDSIIAPIQEFTPSALPLVSIHATDGVDRLATQIVREEKMLITQYQPERKPSSYLKDFTATAGLVLIIFFAILTRIHPKLAADYFSIQRILSIRDLDEADTHSRFALSSNIWFYIFFSMLLAFVLLLIFIHLPDEYYLASSFNTNSFGSITFEWLKLSAILVTVLFVKGLIIVALSPLFGMKEIAGVHFFNAIRILLIVTSVLSVIVFIYFISVGRNGNVYYGLLIVFVVTLILWVVLLFLKLNSRVAHTMFHLFSYICATEVIPLLITIKVLFQ